MLDPALMAAGAATGLVVGLTGVGGGALMTPLLLLVFGVAPVTAVATDLWFAALTKLCGARVHHAAGHVDWQVARRLWAGSLPVALLVVAWVAAGGRAARLDWLGQAVGAVVLLTALGMVAAPWAARRLRASGTVAKGGGALGTALAGAALGLLVALTSVGAGALGSVLLQALYPGRMTPHRLVATDIVHAIPLALVAGIGYLWAGLVDWGMLASLLAGSIPAVALGSRWSVRLPAGGVRLALSAVLVAVGVKALVG